MNELDASAKRVLEQGLPLDGPSDETRLRLKRRLLLAVSGGAGLVAGTAPAAGAAAPALAGAVVGTKSLTAGSLALWFALGLGAGTGVAGSALLVTASTNRSAPAAPQAPDVPSAQPSPAKTRDEAPHTAAPNEAPSTSPGERDEPIRPQPSPGAPPSRSERAELPKATAATAALPASASASTRSREATLSEEAALVQRAQRALAANEPRAALTALDEHERRFPSGALAEERTAARVLALCGLGRIDEATSVALALMSAAPDSVLVPRLERSCAGPRLRR